MRSRDFQRGFFGMSRRDFLFGTAATAAASAMSGLALAQDSATLAKLDRISLLTNDFSGILPEIWDRSKPVAPGKMDMMDLPDAVAEHLHLHNLEVCNINLLSMKASYINEFKERLRKARSRAMSASVLPILKFALTQLKSRRSGLILRQCWGLPVSCPTRGSATCRKT